MFKHCDSVATPLARPLMRVRGLVNCNNQVVSDHVCNGNQLDKMINDSFSAINSNCKIWAVPFGKLFTMLLTFQALPFIALMKLFPFLQTAFIGNAFHLRF